MKSKVATAIYESTAYAMIQSAKINLDNQGLAIISSGISQPGIEHALTAQIENYLNALDYVCNLYFSHDIDGQRFVLLYQNDIKNIYESGVYAQHVNLNAFINLDLFHKMIDAVNKSEKTA